MSNKELSSRELRELYQDNKEVLKKMYSMLDNAVESKDMENVVLIKSSIMKLKKEQNEISKKIRKKVYNNVSKKTSNYLKNYVSDLDKTEELPIKEVQEELFKNARVYFDGKYKLFFNDDKDCVEYSNGLVNYETDDIFDMNIIGLLVDFDKENHTNLYNRYINGDLDVLYNFKNTNDKISKRELNIIKKKAKLCDKRIEKINCVYKNKNWVKRSLVTAGLLVTASLSLLGLKSRKNNVREVATTTTIEQSMDNKLVTEPITESVTEVQEEVKEDIVKVDTSTKKEEVKEEKKEIDESLKIGDVYSLNETDLYYSSTDVSPRGNTKYLNNYNYKAGIISVVYKGRVVMLVDNDSVSLDALEKECKEKYGDDVKLSINFDLVDENDNVITKYVGWVNSDDVKSKGKVLTR